MKAPSGTQISVVIPCFNQARYLDQAIASVLCQSWPRVEIIIVNDGSTDHTAEVAAQHPQVRYFYQVNQGRSAARNFGARQSSGAYLVFLDADDELLPNALEDGMKCFDQHPDSGFVYGQYRLIAADGSPLPLAPRVAPAEESYQTFLQQNSVGMLAAVMFRRAAFEAVNGFDGKLQACEDYELYLRIARTCPVARHQHLVALYRQHGSNTTLDSQLMLLTALDVLQAQRPWVRGNQHHEAALQKGIAFAREVYGHRLMADVQRNLTSVRTWARALPGIMMILRHYPDGVKRGLSRRLKAFFRGSWQSQPGTRP